MSASSRKKRFKWGSTDDADAIRLALNYVQGRDEEELKLYLFLPTIKHYIQRRNIL